MNIEKLIDSLNSSEKAEAYNLLYNWNRKLARENANKIKLTREERELARKDKVSAIRAVRNRVGCLLMESKFAVESFLEMPRI